MASQSSEEWPAVQRTIDKFGSSINRYRRNLGQLQQSPRVDAGRNFLAQRINETRYPFVILSTINPRGKITAGPDLRSKGDEASARIGQMMQHANGKPVIEDRSQRQTVDICLNDVGIFQSTGCGESRLHRCTEVDTDDFARTPLRGELRMAALSTTALNHEFTAEEFGFDGTNPAQKLVRILIVFLCEVLPLPAKIFCRFCLVLFYLIEIGKTRHTAQHGKMLGATRAFQNCLKNFVLLAAGNCVQPEVPGTSGAGQVLQQFFFHRNCSAAGIGTWETY